MILPATIRVSVAWKGNNDVVSQPGYLKITDSLSTDDRLCGTYPFDHGCNFFRLMNPPEYIVTFLLLCISLYLANHSQGYIL